VTAAHSILPDILSTFRANYQNVQIYLQTGDAAEAMAKLLSNEADISIAALPEKLPLKIKSIPLMQTPLVFAAPVNYPEIIQYDATGIDWSITPILLAEKGLSRIHLDRWFRQQQIIPNVYAQVAGNEALLAMISLGCGVGVVPKLVLEKSLIRHEVTILDDAPVLTPFTIGVCTNKRNMNSPLIQAFWQTVKKHEHSVV
jgi:LysR family positive regulator for ilvC